MPLISVWGAPAKDCYLFLQIRNCDRVEIFAKCEKCYVSRGQPDVEEMEEEKEEEGDLFVFNDTIEGPRAPAVKPGRVTKA